jgi:hypothetical protein
MATMPTNAAWVDAWQALSISGVNVLATPPLSLNTADLPAAWPELPEMLLGDLLVSCVNENKLRIIDFQVAIEPIGQNTQKGNYEAVIPILDEIETAIDALTIMNFIDYEMRGTADIRIADVPYWGIRVRATGRNIR